MRLILSTLGTGYIPRAGGTFASLLALPLLWFLNPYPWILASIFLVLTGLGIWLSSYAEHRRWNHDDKRITIDEFCGMLAAGFMLTYPVHTHSSFLWTSLVRLALAFGLFRLLDILKPPPMKWMERLPGGWGVMGDDLLAAIISNGAVRLLALLPIPVIQG